MQEIHDLPVLAPRLPESNKGDYGKVLVVAGSRGMSGAAILCASAALRGGAGLVRLVVPEGILAIVAAANPCYTTVPLPQDAEGRLAATEALVISRARDNDVVAMGPGLGRSPELTRLLTGLIPKMDRPMVLDADGLNALADNPEVLGQHGGPMIITPHPGEFARLLHTNIASVQAGRSEQAARFARDRRLVVVLKGHGTIVTDGERIYRNRTGNPGMASGGTGDVLTGLIAALLGQGLEPFAAAQLGVHLHGLAGDLARDDVGEVCMIASDLLDYLAPAFRGGL